MENWEGPGIPVDLIMMFHVLYFIRAGERQEVLKKVHDNWLVSGGYVSVLTGTKVPGSTGVFERLGLPAPSSEEIEADFLKIGFTRHYKHEMHATRDLRDPNESLLPFYQLHCKDRLITLDDLREAMKGKNFDESRYTITIYKSRN